MSRGKNLALLGIFVIFALVTSYLMWEIVGWFLIPQIILVLAIVNVGENFVSSQGYYNYPRANYNGPFIKNVPLWITFLWIFSIQGSYLFLVSIGLNTIPAVIFSGLIASIADFILFEPLMSSFLGLWQWTPVENGYFRFIPSWFNRFTAPTGNYVVWLLFPIISNFSLVFPMLLF